MNISVHFKCMISKLKRKDNYSYLLNNAIQVLNKGSGETENVYSFNKHS